MKHFDSQMDASNAIGRDEIAIGEHFTIEGMGTFKRKDAHWMIQVPAADESTPVARMRKLIERAAKYDLDLEPRDFTLEADGSLTIDDMDAAEWVDAMTMD